MGDDYEDEYCRFIDDWPEPAPTRGLPQKPLWVVHMTHQGKSAERARNDGFICVGWSDIGDLKALGSQGRIREAIRKSNPERDPGTITKWASEAFNFVYEMKRGQLLVHPMTAKGKLKIGEVTGDYRFSGEDEELVKTDSANVVPVKWLVELPRSMLSESAQQDFGQRFTVRNFPEHREEIQKLVAHLDVF